MLCLLLSGFFSFSCLAYSPEVTNWRTALRALSVFLLVQKSYLKSGRKKRVQFDRSRCRLLLRFRFPECERAARHSSELRLSVMFLFNPSMEPAHVGNPRSSIWEHLFLLIKVMNFIFSVG